MLARLSLAIALMGAVLAPAGVAADQSLVLAWNSALLDAVRAETTPPPLASRNLAIAHLVLDDACRASEGRAGAMLAISGCVVSSALYPGRRGQFELLRDQALAEISPAPTQQEWTRALRCAADVLESRSSDGASRSVTYIPRIGDGAWRRTPPFFRPPELPQWPGVRPFALADPKLLVPGGPPGLDSAAWHAGLEEVRRLGARDSAVRTAEQSLIARFWSDFSYTTTPPGHWNLIAANVARARQFDEPTTARLFASLNVALADAAIVCWETKYRFNFWRPATVLAGEGWESFLSTPAHPEYPSGHGAFSGAAATVLATFTGDDAFEFTVTSDALPGVRRTFHSFSEAALEIGMSRVYAGIHYRFSCDDGVALGRAVGREIMDREQQVMATTTITEVATR